MCAAARDGEPHMDLAAFLLGSCVGSAAEPAAHPPLFRARAADDHANDPCAVLDAVNALRLDSELRPAIGRPSGIDGVRARRTDRFCVIAALCPVKNRRR